MEELKPLGPLHWKTEPPFPALAYRVEEVLIQVRTPFDPAVTVGGRVFAVTCTVDVAVQPVTGCVTIKVYVPAAVTVGFWMVDE